MIMTYSHIHYWYNGQQQNNPTHRRNPRLDSRWRAPRRSACRRPRIVHRLESRAWWDKRYGQIRGSWLCQPLGRGCRIYRLEVRGSEKRLRLWGLQSWGGVRMRWGWWERTSLLMEGLCSDLAWGSLRADDPWSQELCFGFRLDGELWTFL